MIPTRSLIVKQNFPGKYRDAANFVVVCGGPVASTGGTQRVEQVTEAADTGNQPAAVRPASGPNY
jgi:hypothetical protein